MTYLAAVRFGTLAITLSLFYIAGCSTTPFYSQEAQAADLATTAIVLSNGAVESNALISGADPLTWVGIGVVKLTLPIITSKLSQGACEGTQTVLFGLGAGAAANNLLVMAGAVGGWQVAIPLGLVAMIVYNKFGWYTHDCPQSDSTQVAST